MSVASSRACRLPDDTCITVGWRSTSWAGSRSAGGRDDHHVHDGPGGGTATVEAGHGPERFRPFWRLLVFHQAAASDGTPSDRSALAGPVRQVGDDLGRRSLADRARTSRAAPSVIVSTARSATEHAPMIDDDQFVGRVPTRRGGWRPGRGACGVGVAGRFVENRHTGASCRRQADPQRSLRRGSAGDGVLQGTASAPGRPRRGRPLGRAGEIDPRSDRPAAPSRAFQIGGAAGSAANRSRTGSDPEPWCPASSASMSFERRTPAFPGRQGVDADWCRWRMTAFGDDPLAASRAAAGSVVASGGPGDHARGRWRRGGPPWKGRDFLDAGGESARRPPSGCEVHLRRSSMRSRRRAWLDRVRGSGRAEGSCAARSSVCTGWGIGVAGQRTPSRRCRRTSRPTSLMFDHRGSSGRPGRRSRPG